MKKSIAVTGGIGSGKSTLLKCIQAMGYPVFSCDEIYKEIVQSSAYIKKIEEVFPAAVVAASIDKKVLADIIFNDDEKREILNRLSHPLIMAELNARMAKCADEYVFAEVPLLFEGNFEKTFDAVILVIRDEEDRIFSITQRDGISRERAKERIAAQFDYNSIEGKKRLKNCNVIVLKNDGSIEELKNQLNEVLKRL